MDKPSVNSKSERHPFSLDKPIFSRSEDRLGRTGFASDLAKAINGWHGKDSLVVAIYGQWGYGKTSLKNLVLEHLNRSQSQRPIIIEFNPWQWEGQKHLLISFFSEVGKAIGKSSGKDYKQLEHQWRIYTAYLNLISFKPDSIRTALIGITSMVAFLGLSGALFAESWVKSILGYMGILGGVLAAAIALSKGVTERISDLYKVLSTSEKKTLSELKVDLANSLGNIESPILVVVDDIDRLATQEVALLFQLIKANADFPKITYLLLFDREIIERSLDAVSGSSGKQFMEKIVNIGLNIPKIERVHLEKVLFEELDQLLANEVVGRNFDKTRWASVYWAGFNLYFSTLRDVKRYISTLSFYINCYKKEDVLEVNIIDLIVVEAIRLFDPSVYLEISSSKDVFLVSRGERLTDRFGGEALKKRQELLEEIFKQSKLNPEQFKELFEKLFPQADGADHSYAYDGWYRQLRVCHPDLFQRYFHFRVPEGDISQAILDEVLACAGDREKFRNKLNELNANKRLGIFLDRLEAYKQSIDLKYAVPFITALFDIGDELPSNSDGFLSLDSKDHSHRIVHWYLKQEAEPVRRYEILKQAITDTEGIYLPIRTVNYENRDKGEGKNPESYLVPDDKVRELEEMCLSKIKHIAQSGQLEHHAELATILYRWLNWADPAEVKTWVANFINSEAGLIRFLSALSSKVGTASNGGDVYAEKVNVKLKNVESFAILEDVEKGVRKINASDLPIEQKSVIEAFNIALDKRKAGKPEDDFF